MKKKDNRRNFLKTSALVGSSVLLKQSDVYAEDAKKSEKTPEINETIKTIRSLRTTHGNFSNKEIPDETIKLIIDSSVRAANVSNIQPYSIIVIKDRDKMEQLCGYRGSCVLLYCIDRTRIKDSAEVLGYTFYPDNMTYFMVDVISTVLALQTAAIAARSLGIDYLTTNGVHRGNMQRVWDILDLPEKHCYPIIALVLGYPTKEPDRKAGRLTGPGIVHWEKYKRLAKEETKQMIEKYDDEKNRLSLMFGMNFKDKGYKHYLDWFFKYWSDNLQPTRQDTQIFKFLKKTGFVETQRT